MLLLLLLLLPLLLLLMLLLLLLLLCKLDIVGSAVVHLLLRLYIVPSH
jgi:hypothetical protein